MIKGVQVRETNDDVHVLVYELELVYDGWKALEV